MINSTKLVVQRENIDNTVTALFLKIVMSPLTAFVSTFVSNLIKAALTAAALCLL